MDAIHIINCHAAGEVGDVVVSGFPIPPGKSLLEQAQSIAVAPIRNYLMNEPRGGVFRHKNILVPPKNQSADIAFIVIEPDDVPSMSGSNCICVVTAILECGMHPISEPITKLRVESPAGLLDVTAECKNGKVEAVRFKNVRSYAGHLGQILEIEGIGSIVVDTAYGGDSFVVVDIHQLGLQVQPDQAREIAELGVRITNAANEQLNKVHPAIPILGFSLCQMIEPIYEENGIKVGRQCVAIRPGKIDRSPCGTGCSARMALMYARGELVQDELFVAESMIGTRFHCRIVEGSPGQSRNGIIPEISGTAWITGKQELWLDPADPFPQGYRLNDTWPSIS